MPMDSNKGPLKKVMSRIDIFKEEMRGEILMCSLRGEPKESKREEREVKDPFHIPKASSMYLL